MARAFVVWLLAVLAAAVLAGPAAAREVVLRDDQGREMHFDVRADVDVPWYAGLLRRAPHADEIERVTIRIVSWDELGERCGRRVAGCYSRRKGNRGVMVVPAGRSFGIAHTVIHEYGHHVDWSRRHSNLAEPNGTPLWWKARGMDELVAIRSVRDRYQVGWNRSIAEVFAEDYAYTHFGRGYRISWLEPPSRVVQQAIRADLGLADRPRIVDAQPAIRPVVIVRQGTLAPNDRVAVDFGLLGPNRHVRLEGAFRNAAAAQGRIEVTCEGAAARRRLLSAAQPAATLVMPRVGPAQCRASIANTGSRSEPFRFTVRLTIRR
jgi:hypothetical protein